MAKILGIDLGTTNSASAIVEAGNPKVLENSEGSRTTPSVVAVSKSGERLVGVLAKRQSVTNPHNTIYSVKRIIGRRYSDIEVQKILPKMPYEHRKGENDSIEIKFGEKWVRPEEISAMVLQKIKADAEERLGEQITEAVITIPAYFNDSQRAATKVAGEIAGFEVKRILPEPTAAALAYGLDKKNSAKILVYDFGGGTFDVSILEIGDNVIEAKGIGGNSLLGGDDLDQRVIEFLIAEFKKEEGMDISKDPLSLQRLKEAAEKAKQELSTMQETEINLPFVTSDSSGNPKHLFYKITRGKLEELTRDLIEQSIELTEKTLKEINFTKNDIDEIILVGGQTRMPLIQQRVKEYFGKEPKKDINPDEVVAIGASIQAGILQGDVREVLLLDVTPLTFGIETLGGVCHPMIPKNTPIPYSKQEVFTTAADNQTSVEVHVAQGERPMAVDNKTLARFILDGVALAPRGMPQVEVSFDIDVNGILTIAAKDKATGKSQTVKVEGSTHLKDEEIERMKKDADLYAEEDRKKKELADVKNQADAIVHQVRKTLAEHGDKIDGQLKETIEEKVKHIEEVKNQQDVAPIKSAIDELSTLLSQIGQQIYKDQGQSQQNGADAQAESQQPSPDDVPPSM